MNILRGIFREPELRNVVQPFISDAMILTVNGFSSCNWAIRNGSQLLFSALMMRMFGVNRQKEFFASKNCKTGLEFFTQNPELHGFFSQKLSVYVTKSHKDGRFNFALFPILISLSRLYPAFFAQDQSLRGFLAPILFIAFKSPIFFIRCLAGFVLSRIADQTEQTAIFDQILTLNFLNFNAIHGWLCIVGEIWPNVKEFLPIDARMALRNRLAELITSNTVEIQK